MTSSRKPLHLGAGKSSAANAPPPHWANRNKSKAHFFQPQLQSDYSIFRVLIYSELLLIFCGAVFLYSNSSFYMLQRHMIRLSFGLLFSVGLYFIPLRIIIRFIPLFAYLALLLNILPQVPGLGYANYGSPRWIYIGNFSFQTSEALRIMIILYFTRCFSTIKQEEPLRKIQFRPIIYLSLACTLVIIQKDYSTTMILITLGAALALLVGSWPILIFSFIVTTVSTLVALFFLGQNFRGDRLSDWVDGSGEQINWVFDTFQKGGLLGKGLGQGTYKHIIPAEMTDFPLAGVGEETGLLGIVLVIALFALFAILGFILALRSRSPFVRYATAGLTGLIFLQAFINLSVSTGLLPVTGQPLPFFSVGGTSTLFNIITFGIINALNKPQKGHLVKP